MGITRRRWALALLLLVAQLGRCAAQDGGWRKARATRYGGADDW
jgi:hypothetical protein